MNNNHTLPISQNELHTLCKHLESLWHSHPCFILGIDGKCGAGKSTLASYLATMYDTSVIHMDDFYLPFALRTFERIQEPGGNVHYERFLEEIYMPLKVFRESPSFLPSSDDRSVASYQIFSCQSGDYTDTCHIYPRPLIIVEGSYSMRPEFRDLYDITIFLDIDPNLQIERLRNRVGSEALTAFTEKWIPIENLYFATGIPQACDHCFFIK